MHLIYVSSVMNVSSTNFNGFILLGLDRDMGFETTSLGQLELRNCIVWSLTWYRILILHVLFFETTYSLYSFQFLVVISFSSGQMQSIMWSAFRHLS